MKSSEITVELNEKGVVKVENFFNHEVLCPEFQQYLIEPESEYALVRDYDSGSAKLLIKDKLPSDSRTKQFFSQSLFSELLELYWPDQNLGCNHRIFVVKDVPGTKHIAQDLHFDVARTLKFFLYLTDTDEKNAAFKCVPGSHKWVMDNRRKKYKDKISYDNRHLSRVPEFNDQAISMNGKAGDLIIFDTDTLHCAGQCSDGERWVMRGQSEDYKWEYKRSLFSRVFKR